MGQIITLPPRIVTLFHCSKCSRPSELKNGPIHVLTESFNDDDNGRVEFQVDAERCCEHCGAPVIHNVFDLEYDVPETLLERHVDCFLNEGDDYLEMMFNLDVHRVVWDNPPGHVGVKLCFTLACGDCREPLLTRTLSGETIEAEMERHA